LDIDNKTAQNYTDRLTEQKKEQQETIKRLKDRLTNKNYVEKAPKVLVEESKLQLAKEEELLYKVTAEIESFRRSLKG
jgi:valyl-tRNA synthetase